MNLVIAFGADAWREVAPSMAPASLAPFSEVMRIAALVAVDAPPASYLLNLGAADAVGVDGETVRDVFAAVAPIVGTARVASAVGNVVRALGFAELGAEQIPTAETATIDEPTDSAALALRAALSSWFGTPLKETVPIVDRPS